MNFSLERDSTAAIWRTHKTEATNQFFSRFFFVLFATNSSLALQKRKQHPWAVDRGRQGNPFAFFSSLFSPSAGRFTFPWLALRCVWRLWLSGSVTGCVRACNWEMPRCVVALLLCTLEGRGIQHSRNSFQSCTLPLIPKPWTERSLSLLLPRRRMQFLSSFFLVSTGCFFFYYFLEN